MRTGCGAAAVGVISARKNMKAINPLIEVCLSQSTPQGEWSTVEWIRELELESFLARAIENGIVCKAWGEVSWQRQLAEMESQQDS